MKDIDIIEFINKLAVYATSKGIKNCRDLVLISALLYSGALIVVKSYIWLGILIAFVLVTLIYYWKLACIGLLTRNNRLAAVSIALIHFIIFLNVFLFVFPSMMKLETPKWFPALFIVGTAFAVLGFWYTLNSAKKGHLPKLTAAAAAPVAPLSAAVIGYLLAKYFMPSLSLNSQLIMYTAIFLYGIGMLAFAFGMLYISSWYFITKLKLPDEIL